MILATTTSLNDIGLLEILIKKLKEETGIELDFVSSGTGKAIKIGESGDADALIVHAKAAEENFIRQGHGLQRTPFMHNYFYIVGPKDDPAGIKGMENAADALKKIFQSGSKFVSRGDDSGTHMKEQELLKSVGIDLKSSENYISAKKGMADTLELANEKNAYTMTDMATYFSLKNKFSNLCVMLGGTEDLKNVYSIILVNKEKHENINAEDANKFKEWLLKKETLDVIEKYGKDKFGQELFIIDYKTN